MGDAKRRAKLRENEKLARMERLLGLGIQPMEPGFYDHPSFQEQERADPAFLEAYGCYVRDREYRPEYLARAEALIRRISTELQAEMAKADRNRACMDGGLALSKMLEQVGVWNFVVRGAFSAEVVGQPLTWRCFHAFGPLDPGATVHGHVWLHAPPFFVVDVAAKLQPWGVPALQANIPDVAYATEMGGVEPDPRLLLDPDLVEAARSLGVNLNLRELFSQHPQVRPFMQGFPGTRVPVGDALLTYMPTAITAPDVPFEEIGVGPGGLHAKQVWERIRPTVADLL